MIRNSVFPSHLIKSNEKPLWLSFKMCEGACCVYRFPAKIKLHNKNRINESSMLAGNYQGLTATTCLCHQCCQSQWQWCKEWRLTAVNGMKNLMAIKAIHSNMQLVGSQPNSFAAQSFESYVKRIPSYIPVKRCLWKDFSLLIIK